MSGVGGESERVGAADPSEAWGRLQSDPGAHLVDVRTMAEWTFVGLPDLSDAAKRVWTIEWKSFPTMSPNPRFAETLAAARRQSEATALFFLCRSGQRSHDAAVAAAMDAGFDGVELYNVVEGFEGPPDAEGRRGTVQGWKARGLPWRQS